MTSEELTQQVRLLQERIQLLEDKEAIRDILIRWGATADLGRFDDFVQQLAEDGVWIAKGLDAKGQEYVRTSEGREAHRAMVAGPRGVELVNQVQHVMVDSLIQVDGDTAQALCDLILTFRAPDEDGLVGFGSHFGIATCRKVIASLHRLEGKWLIKRIEFREIGGTLTRDMPGHAELLAAT